MKHNKNKKYDTSKAYGNDFENYKNMNAHIFNESDDERVIMGDN